MTGPSIDDRIVSELKTALETLIGHPVNASNAPDAEDLRSPWEFITAIAEAQAPPELLAIIGSYGDTLDDEEVLQLLKDWNATGKVMHEIQ